MGKCVIRCSLSYLDRRRAGSRRLHRSLHGLCLPLAAKDRIKDALMSGLPVLDGERHGGSGTAS